MKIRNPKSEIRSGRIGARRLRRFDGHIFKPPRLIVASSTMSSESGANAALLSPRFRRARPVGFRHSDFFRISDFGFRILFASLCTAIAQVLRSLRRNFGCRFPDLTRLTYLTYLTFGCSFPLCVLAPMSVFAITNATPRDEIPPLRPPQGEIPPSFWEQHGAAVVVGCLVALALVGAAIWFLTRPKPRVVVPPEIQARRALEALAKRPEDGAVLSAVSQVVRRYVATAFALPLEELTTTEFCRAIADHEGLGPELAAAVGEFLRRADERKFAPSPPLPPLGAVSHALELIELAENRRAQLRQAVSHPEAVKK
jgi:hypothetical protein